MQYISIPTGVKLDKDEWEFDDVGFTKPTILKLDTWKNPIGVIGSQYKKGDTYKDSTGEYTVLGVTASQGDDGYLFFNLHL
jgi:hypothetical protein